MLPGHQEEDHYLHPLSVIFSLVDLIKQNLIPAVLGIFGAARGDLFFVGVAVLFFVPTMAVSLIRYFTIRYRISNGELVVQEGLIFQRVRTVPVERIQNIDLVQGVLHRMLNLAEVRVETASGTKPEAVLKVLSLEQVELLRAGVRQQRSVVVDNADSSLTNKNEVTPSQLDSVADDQGHQLLKIPLWWLAQAGFASNKGFVLVGLLVGFYLQFDRRNPGDIDAAIFSGLGDMFPDDGGMLMTFCIAAAVLIAGMLLLRMLGIGWFILRFYGYELRQVGDDFKISCGLLTRVSATIPRKRIQFISVHRSLLMRLMKLAAIRIETAGGAADNNENATTTVSRRWFIPVIHESAVVQMLSELRPELNVGDRPHHWVGLSARAPKRFVRLACLGALAIVAAAFFFAGWKWAVLALTSFPVLIIYALKKSRSMKFAHSDLGVVYKSGVLTLKTSYTFFEKIQAASWTQTPFDQRWGMAKLLVDTAAAGPAQHAIEIGYLDATVAQEEYQRIVQRASGKA